jgi:GNAT superfamily N-acetyltransferase
LSGFSLRRATSADAARIAELRLEFLREEAQGVDDDDAMLATVTSYLQRTLADGDVAAFVGEVAGTIVATGVVTIYERMMWSGVGREGYVLSMYTQPAHRRQGIGSAIVDAIVGFARSEGLKLAMIATDAGRPLYERAGFTPDNRYLRWRSQD